MKAIIKYLFIFAVFFGMVVTPVYAMEGTDGTVDEPTNRNVEVVPINEEINLDRDVIETEEGYENIVPISGEQIDDLDLLEEEVENENSWLIILMTGAALVFMAGTIALIIAMRKKK